MYNFDKNFINTHTLAECLDKYDCTYQALRTWCLLHRAKYLKNKKVKRYLKYPDIGKYAGKMTDLEVAEILGCPRRKVVEYRIDHGIRPYKKHRNTIAKNNIDEILADYNELKSLQKVADKHGVTRERVRQWFSAAGYHYVKNVGYVK